jgi:protein-histidine pros-kinase
MNLIDGVIFICSIIIIALGGSVIFGWLSQNTSLVQVATNYSPMQFNTALGFLLLGIAILFIQKQPIVARVVGIYLALVGSLTLLEYLAGINLSIDEIFIKSFMADAVFPGRPASNTAFCLLLSGLALLLLVSKWHSAWKMQIGLTLSLLIGGIGLFAFIGYITYIPTAYGWGSLTQMSVHTSIGFVLAAILLTARYWQVFQKGDLNKNSFLAICVFVLGTISFILIWQELVKKEHQKTEYNVRQEIKFIQSEFAEEFETTLTAIHRMQDRLMDTNGYSSETWEKDVRNYYQTSPNILLFAIADANGTWSKVPRTDSIPASLNTQLDSCYAQIQQNKTSNKNVWFIPTDKNNICVVYPIADKNMLFILFDLSIYMDEIRLANTKEDYSIQLFKDNDLIYFYDNHASSLLKHEWAITSTFQFHGLPLEVIMWPTEKIIQNNSNWVPTLSLMVGILLTSLLSSVIYLIGMMKIKQKSLIEAEQRTSTIINKTREAFIAIDKRGQIIDWNEQAEIIFGWTKAEIIGQQLDKTIIPMKYRNAHTKGMRHYFKTGEGPVLNKRIELTALRKNGDEFPIELSITPLQFEEETIFSAFLYDITERKKFENEQATLTAIMQYSDDAIIGLNLQGMVLSWNKGAEKIYGYAAADTIGKSITFLYPEDRKEEFTLFSYKLQMGQKVQAMETYRVCKSGHVIPVSLTVSPIKNSKNEMIGISTTARDISLQKELDEKLKLKNVELENANLAKDRFLASMSHELRTPLNAIIGFTGTLLMQLPGPLNDDQRKQLQTVQHSAKHLLSLINDILDLAKIESGKIELTFDKVNCNEIIKNVMIFMDGLAKAKNITFESVLPVEDVFVNADRRSLTQILLNLTSNAIKFTEKGSVTLELKIQSIQGKDHVVMYVKDTGVGIKKEDRNKLFKAFEKINVPGKFAEGTGLGLHLCKKLARLLNAKIDFKSEFGHGTCFTVTLLLEPTEETVTESSEDTLKKS